MQVKEFYPGTALKALFQNVQTSGPTNLALSNVSYFGRQPKKKRHFSTQVQTMNILTTHFMIFIITPCINDTKQLSQLMHTTWKR